MWICQNYDLQKCELRHDLICQIWNFYKCVGTWDIIGFDKLEIGTSWVDHVA